MKVPLNWLKEYIEIPADVQEISRVFTSLGYMLDGQPKDIEGDTVLDLEVRQNRGDCLSLMGLAEELSAYYKTPVKDPENDPKSLICPSKQAMTIDDKKKCYRFNTLRIEGVKNGTSPSWMQKRLLSYGITPINTVVDITNYVMIEIGQPLHAFDAEKVNGEVRIGLAKKGEILTTLSGTAVELSPDDIIIRDEKGILALAGIIGGESSKVNDKTHTIILEAATYDQAHIRRASRRHGVRTEASTRLEKLLHPELTEIALARAAFLMKELTGGTVTDHTDIYPTRNEFKTRKIDLTFANVTSLTGVEMSKSEIVTNLELLGFETSKENETYCEVSIPFYRTDVELEEDIIEEVIRLYGYDNIPAVLPSAPAPKQIDSPIFLLEESVRDILISCGYDEQITESLTHYDAPGDDVITLQNALTSEKDMLRTTLQNGLVYGVKNRMKYRETDIRLFEIGKVYFKRGKVLTEESHLGIIWSCNEATYPQIKGLCEILFERTNRKYNEELITTQRVLDLSAPTFFVQINLERLADLPKEVKSIVYIAPPQINEHNVSTISPRSTDPKRIIEAANLDISNRAKSAISGATIAQAILGEPPRIISGDEQSLFINFKFTNPENTTTTDKINTAVAGTISYLQESFGVKLRE